jgi:hypothetical protein
MSRKRNQTSIGTIVTGTPTAKCHTGNVVVLRAPGKNGGKLLCGGWSRGACTDDVAVIDLTGIEPIDVDNPLKPRNDAAATAFAKAIATSSAGRELPWLAFKIKDFGVPTAKRETWVELADAILALMGDGKDVLLVCQGGHGRTGAAASIICHLVNPDIGDPVKYLRAVYCNDAVETYEQHQYVHKMLNLPDPEKIEYKREYSVGKWSSSSYDSYGGAYSGRGSCYWQPGQVWNPDTKQYELPTPPPKKEDGDAWVDGFVKSLDAIGIDYEVIYYSTGRVVQVALIVDKDLSYWEVENPPVDGAVVLLGTHYDEIRTSRVADLATKSEVTSFYAQG